MIKAVLQFRDGLPSGRIFLRSVVKNAQRGLVEGGHELTTDGKYGSGTRTAVKAFQAARGLEPNGIVERATWKRLDPHLQAVVGPREAEIAGLLQKFRGDLGWVHQQESHAGKPYWPGSVSGVTLDPGVDLGHVSSWDFIEEQYGPLVTQSQLAELRKVFGFKGMDARVALGASPILQSVRITREQAVELMPHTARPYWEGITSRFRAVARVDTPASVQTTLLSLAYNRGSQNRHLEPLGELLQDRRWGEAADTIGSMQQNHELPGIRRRRRREAAVIRAELDFLAS